MPEGDTIFRSARSLHQWLASRTVTAAESRVEAVPSRVLVGRVVEAVEPIGKHLMMRLSGGVTLHSHMKMTGAWHVYSAGDRWQKPNADARIVIECGERIAVCFNAPVIELLDVHQETTHPSLSRLGPDVLGDPLDVNAIVERARSRPDETPVGELILDQGVMAGIGNIYRCESLFIRRLNPWRETGDVTDEELSELVQAAARLMRRNLVVGLGFGRDFGGGPDQPYVYGRAGRPCYRCRQPIQVTKLGVTQPRDIWWCDKCQPGVADFGA